MINRTSYNNPVKKYMDLLHKPKTFDKGVKSVYNRKAKHVLTKNCLIKQEYL